VNSGANFSQPATPQTFKNIDKLTKVFIDTIVAKLVPNLQPSQAQSSSQQQVPPTKPTHSPLQIQPDDDRNRYRRPYGSGGVDDDPIGDFGTGSDDMNPFTPPGTRGPRRGGHLGGFGGGSEIGPHHPGFGPNVNDPYSGGGHPFPGVFGPPANPQGDPDNDQLPPPGFGDGQLFPGVPSRGAGRGDLRPGGARFDPFGPPANPPGGPDDDQLPPPGYGDMFM